MEIKIAALNMKLEDDVREYAERKLGKLSSISTISARSNWT